MKTTITIEISHKCKLPYMLEKKLEQKTYDYLYAQGCQVGVRTIRNVTSLDDSEPSDLDSGDKQVLFVAGSKALLGNVA